jgi:hypothetical protein
MKNTLNIKSFVAILCWILTSNVYAIDAITVGDVEIDPSTLCCIGLALPITSGDDNYNAEVNVQYRKAGATTWKDALPLLRLRPEYHDENLYNVYYTLNFPITEQFAGSILDLDADTSYEVKLNVIDPDGGNVVKMVNVSTRAAPRIDPVSANVVNVSNTAQLNTALNQATAGDVIVLANGTYAGPITISKSGSPDNPIIIRGESQYGVIIDATGKDAGIYIQGSNVYVEDLSVQNSNWGAKFLGDISGSVIRRTSMTNLTLGIDAREGTKKNLYICDNILEGNIQFPTIGPSTYNTEGIVVAGSGHVICHNTLSGFGDTLGLSNLTNIPNRAIDFYGNEVLWGGDDGIELDEGQRNIRAFRNRVTNSSTGLSFQPLWAGPAYVFRNIFYNTIQEKPFKWNDNPTGLLVFHNTLVRANHSWKQYSTDFLANIKFFNNLVIGTAGSMDIVPPMQLVEFDYNGWFPDSSFGFGNIGASNFADLQQNTPYENNGVLLNGTIFENDVPVLTEMTTNSQIFRDPADFTLHSGSNAVDAGKLLPNINDGYLGGAPDIGAQERGVALPIYGVRNQDSTQPGSITGLQVVDVSDTQASISWNAAQDAESGISGYIVYRNGTNVNTVNGTSYTDSGLSESTTYQYEVSAINGAALEGPKSAALSVTTLADTVAPTIEAVAASGVATQVQVTFSEAVNIDSAVFQISPTINVDSVSLSDDHRVVTLGTGALSENVQYTLTVNGVFDEAASPNMISANSAATFAYVTELQITGTTPAGYQWDTLDVGKLAYVDRDYTYQNVAADYIGLDYLRTANDDKNANGDAFLSFSVNQVVQVFVLYDERNTVLPSWLSTWTDTNDQIIVDESGTQQTMHVYSKDFAQGQVQLGGNTYGNSMYTVMVSINGGNTGGGDTGGGDTGGGDTGGGDTGGGDTGGGDTGGGDTGGGDSGGADTGANNPSDSIPTAGALNPWEMLTFVFTVGVFFFRRKSIKFKA